MILLMANTARLISTARRAAVVAAAGAAAVSLAGLGVGAANAAVGDDLDACMAFSQDGGTTWGNQASLQYNNINPIPGSFATHTSFKVKNTCNAPAEFSVLARFWTVGGGGSAQLRADIAGKTGTPATISGTSTDEADIKNLGKSGRLDKDNSVSVDLMIGLPQGESAQGFTIDPGWGLFLTEVAPDTPTDPGTGGGTNPGGGNDNGSLGSLSGGSLGDLFGSGSSSGSLDTVLKGKFSSAPTVVANH